MHRTRIVFFCFALLSVFTGSCLANGGVGDARAVDWKQLTSRPAGGVFLASSESQFNALAAAANPGDVIMIKNGVHDWKLKIPSNGTPSFPIIYTAQTPGKVTFKGSASIKVTGRYNVIGGFKFNQLSKSQAVLFEGGDDNRFTDNEFYEAGKGGSGNKINRYRTVALQINTQASRNRVDHNVWERSYGFGIAVDGQDNRIHNNTFKNFMGSGGTKQPIPLQVGIRANAPTRTVVERNEFIGNNGTNISGKGGSETYLYNRFSNIKGVAIYLRAGDNKHVEGNFFENVRTPIKVYGRNHTIVNNAMKNARTGIQISRWGNYSISRSGRISSSDPTGNIVVAFNTIVNTTNHAIDLGRPWGYAKAKRAVMAQNLPFDVVFKNNILVSNKGILFKNQGASKLDIKNNIFYATGKAKEGEVGNNPIKGDPKLSGLLRPQQGGLADNRGIPISGVNKDLDGNLRSRTPDIGAFEIGGKTLRKKRSKKKSKKKKK